MKYLFFISAFASGILFTKALVINEVMSNPVGDDSGREWIEIYNNDANPVDVATLTVSIKGATPLVVTPLSGGTTLAPSSYAIIGSTVSGATKFLQDYPNYSGPLFKSSMSLVNTGVTSIDIRLNGQVADMLSSYTAAKEGSSLSFVAGSFVQTVPTPGMENSSSAGVNNDTSNATTTTTAQVTVAAQSPPSPDIVIHMPFEKTVVAGAPATFSAYGTTRDDKDIVDLSYVWAFGDGGEATGSSTVYRYAYPGRYIAQVEAKNGSVFGTGQQKVRVVAPDLFITEAGLGKYGAYVDITNPSDYDLDLSQWKLSLDGKAYPFPKNTLIAAKSKTRFSGLAMGFASSTLTEASVIKILFPTQEEVVSYVKSTQAGIVAGTSTVASLLKPVLPKINTAQKTYSKIVISTSTATSGIPLLKNDPQKRDVRLVAWLKSLFH